MRTCITGILLNPLVLLVIGLVLLVLGGGLAADAPAAGAHASLVEQAVALGQATAGQPAWVEGRIHASNLTIHHGFVAYIQEQYRSCGRSSCWSELARWTPPLVVELPSGSTQQIINDDYDIVSTAVTREEAAPTALSGPVRSRGFEAGSPLFALGRATADSTFPALEADILASSTREQYIAGLRAYSRRALVAGTGGIAIGLLCLLIAAWRFRRFVRETKQGPPPPPASVFKSRRRRKSTQKQ
jgi:hypothetical protein